MWSQSKSQHALDPGRTNASGSKGKRKLLSQFKGHQAGRILSYSVEGWPFCCI